MCLTLFLSTSWTHPLFGVYGGVISPLLHSNLVWCHMISRIWGKCNCFNFQKYIVQIHVSTRTSRVACCMKRKKGILVKQTLAHICFLFISLPMTWDLMHRYVYILISTKRWGKKTSSEDSFCKEKTKCPMRRLLPTFLQKVKLSKGQQRKNIWQFWHKLSHYTTKTAPKPDHLIKVSRSSSKSP